jgi:hypothetical protein
MSEKGEDPEKRDEDMRRRAKEAFQGHHISQSQQDSAGGRWLLQRPRRDRSGWDWTMAADIVVMLGGRIVVWGDLHPVLFAHHGPFKDPVEVINWMGKCEDLGYYVRQKASIACHEIVDVWERDVARFQLLEMISPEEVKRQGRSEKFVEGIRKAIEWHLDNGRELFLNFVYSELGYDDYEAVCHVGVVISPRVYYAHAALARLSHLLDLEKEKERGREGQAEGGGDAERNDAHLPDGAPETAG